MFCWLPPLIVGRRAIPRTLRIHCPIEAAGSIRCRNITHHFGIGIPNTVTYHQRYISTTQYRESNVVFVGWSDLEWHNDTFLSNANPQQKEQWLEALLRTESKKVDIEAFMVVLKAWSTSDDPIAPRRAEQWMKRLKDHPHVQPTREAYEAVIRSWANCNKELPIVVANRAERWLNELIEMNRENPDLESLRPTISVYNAYLDACTRGRPGRNKRSVHIVERNAAKADALVRRLHSEYHHNRNTARVVPNTETFNFVMRGWTRCLKDEIVVKKVKGLLRLMESHQRNNPLDSPIRPDTKSYTLMMDALVRLAKMKARQRAGDNEFTTNPSINGLHEMNEAKEILNYMHDLAEAGVEGVVPNTVSYNLLISGWAGLAEARHHNAPLHAEEILRAMFTHQDNGLTEAAPSRVSYEKVMLAWAGSGHPNAGKRAQWWLKKLWNEAELQGDKDLLPTVMTYNIVIRALAKSEGALAAEKVLIDLGELYRNEMSPSLCPNSESFALVIQAWLRQVHYEKEIEERLIALDRAVQWLKSLREIEHGNDLSTTPEQFQQVLMAAITCARNRPEVLEMAKQIFDIQRHTRFGLDVFSYGYLLKVGLEALCSAEANVERTNFVDSLFQNCRDDGLLGRPFVRTLVSSRVESQGWTATERADTMNRLFDTWPFPVSWTRNIRSSLFHARFSDFPGYVLFKHRSIDEEGEDDKDHTGD